MHQRHEPDAIRPDIHIYASSKQPWVVLPPGSKVRPQYYDLLQEWPPESLSRLQAILPRIREYRAALKEQQGGT